MGIGAVIFAMISTYVGLVKAESRSGDKLVYDPLIVEAYNYIGFYEFWSKNSFL
jgi:hypothetical protein